MRYPETHEAHPVGTRAQTTKLLQAAQLAGNIPVRSFVHAYGPTKDVMPRVDVAAATGLPLWINRYGYLSDEKLEALAQRRARLRPG